jgi:hypothetical protein
MPSERPHRRRIGLRIRWAAFGAILGGTVVWLALHFAQRVAEPPTPPEPRLIGTWYSDADATIEEFRKIQPMSDEDELVKRRGRYKTAVTYTGDKVKTQVVDDKPNERTYEVMSKNANRVVLKMWLGDAQQEVRIRFEGENRYWLEFDLPPADGVKLPPVKECFRRIQ